MSNKKLQIYKQFENKWIALDSSKEEVLVWGKNVKDVEDKLQKKNLSAVEIRYILPLNTYIAPVCQ